MPDGTYTITVTPTDGSGNVGDPASTDVTVLTAIKAPAASPSLFNPGDGDALAQTSTQSVTLTEDATVSWVITDYSGNVVRTAMTDQAVSAGPLSWTWDGTNDSANSVPNGIYWTVVTAQTDAGTYSQRLKVRVSPFKISAKPASTTAGKTVKLIVVAAEPQTGRPTVTVKQPGLASYHVYLSGTAGKYTVSFKLKSGGSAGSVKVTVTGTDTNGGVDTQTFTMTET